MYSLPNLGVDIFGGTARPHPLQICELILGKRTNGFIIPQHSKHSVQVLLSQISPHIGKSAFDIMADYELFHILSVLEDTMPDVFFWTLFVITLESP